MVTYQNIYKNLKYLVANDNKILKKLVNKIPSKRVLFALKL